MHVLAKAIDRSQCVSQKECHEVGHVFVFASKE